MNSRIESLLLDLQQRVKKLEDENTELKRWLSREKKKVNITQWLIEHWAPRADFFAWQKNIDLTINNGPYTKAYGGNLDIRPSYSLDYSVFKFDISAIYGQNLKNIEIEKFKLKWENELPNFYTHAIEIINFSNLIINDFYGQPGPKNQKLSTMKLSNGNKTLLKNCETPKEYNLLEQENTKNITIKK